MLGFVLCLFFCALAFHADAAWFGGKKRNFICYVKMDTSLGELTLELYYKQAPRTVENFINYVESGAYNGSIFHKVIPGVMIEGGGFMPDMKPIVAGKHVTNDAGTDLKNLEGMVATVCGSDLNSAPTLFFINLADNPGFDHGSTSGAGQRYCVFGKIVQSTEFMGRITKISTTEKAGYVNVPVTPVIIRRAWEYTQRVHGT